MMMSDADLEAVRERSERATHALDITNSLLPSPPGSYGDSLGEIIRDTAALLAEVDRLRNQRTET